MVVWNDTASAASMVVGSEYQMVWLGLNVIGRSTPSQDGQDLLLACFILSNVGTI
jgi:hypothetical protein